MTSRTFAQAFLALFRVSTVRGHLVLVVIVNVHLNYNWI